MNNVADKLYNILGTKFDNAEIKTLNSKGKETTDMEEIEMFSFDFIVDSHNYGPVVILLSANENLEVYYGDNTSKTLDSAAKKKWENLIEHLSTFARTNRLGFSLKHTSDLKYDLSNLTDITESYRNIFEGYYGTKRTSYNPQGKAKIIIKHSKAIGEDDKRFRNISQLFIENSEGERFKMPFKKLAGARAMARHVTEGGNPYDLFGLHISEMVKDINTLGGFVRRSAMYEGNEEAMGLVETGRNHYNALRKSLNQIAGKRGYHTYKESWEPSEITEVDETTDSIRKLFTEKRIDQRTEDAIPLLAKLQQMAEARGPDDDYEPPMRVVQTVDGPQWVPIDDEEPEYMGRWADVEDPEVLDEKAPPGMEDWIKKNKERFIDQYGKDKGLEVLYATAWKRHNNEDVEQTNSENNKMKELTEFENWADEVTEGTWAVPETSKQAKALRAFLSKPQPLGIDAMNATDALYDIIGDDDLFDELSDIASKDPEADARPVVLTWIRNIIKSGAEFRDPAALRNLKNVIKGVKEGLEGDLDADDENQLNASVNRDMDAHARQGVKEEEDDEEELGPNPLDLDDELQGRVSYGPAFGTQEYRDQVKRDYVAAKKRQGEKPVTESEDPTDLKALMERTNFLLRK